jgi:hypothetical protein
MCFIYHRHFTAKKHRPRCFLAKTRCACCRYHIWQKLMIISTRPPKMRKYEQTVDIFAKPGCSREPRKIPNESPFSKIQKFIRGLHFDKCITTITCINNILWPTSLCTSKHYTICLYISRLSIWYFGVIIW